MKLVALSELFNIEYGHSLELNRMARDSSGLPFVARSSRNNGITGRVARLPNLQPKPAGTLTVAASGSVLETFLQLEPFYTGFHILCLTPKQEMTTVQKLYYATCIRANRYRYSYGRQANRTLKDIQVPALEDLPTWVEEADPAIFDGKDTPAKAESPATLAPASWQPFRLGDLFEFRKGKRLTKAAIKPGDVPFIGAVDKNNGFREWVDRAIHEAGTITVPYNGNGVGEAFYQPVPFWATDDVNVLYPKFEMSPAMALFVCTVIRREKYRFNYGRKWHLERMKDSYVNLPADEEGNPDWATMEQYIKTLAYSSQIGEAPTKPTHPVQKLELASGNA